MMPDFAEFILTPQGAAGWPGVQDHRVFHRRAGHPEADPPATRRNPFLNKGLSQRRARESNPQPLAGHHISSVAASHSLTLRVVRKSSISLTFRLTKFTIYELVSKTTPDTTPDTRC